VGVTEPPGPSGPVSGKDGQSRQERSRELLRQVWLRNRPTTMERLDAGRRDAALSEAHKLRGILGTYGFAEGSELATEAEALFQGAGGEDAAHGLCLRLADYTATLPED
jgi:HPt (histidine-containing phosphotransfer) domain-containing protein